MAQPSVTRIYLSANSTLEPSDTPLVDIAVPELTPGGANALPLSVMIPANTTVGRYYMIAAADADDQIAETNEANNRLSRSIQLGPDLVNGALTVPTYGGAGELAVAMELQFWRRHGVRQPRRSISRSTRRSAPMMRCWAAEA